MLKRIISGGQTGADRGGLEAAIALGIPHGGYCPRGRLAEDGRVPDRYDLTETASREYPDRTLRNIAEADATIVFIEWMDTAGPGSRLTIKVETLNVAGSRESKTPGIEKAVRELLVEVLR